jgi:hypothetical protein
MSKRIAIILAWGLLLLIIVATLSPIGLRPHLGGVRVERFGAFAAVGLLFGVIYPKRLWLVLGAVLAAALSLEALQFLTPDRHGRLMDAGVKMSGGVCGVACAWILHRASAAMRSLRRVSSVNSGDAA